MLRKLLFIVLLVCFIPACGYNLAARGGVIKDDRVELKLFANRTYQPEMEAHLRKALYSELVSRGVNIAVDGSRYLINGEIAELKNDPMAFSASDQVMIYRLALTVKMQLVEKSSGKSVWQGGETMIGEYPANSNPALQRNAMESALSTLSTKIAASLVTQMNRSF